MYKQTGSLNGKDMNKSIKKVTLNVKLLHFVILVILLFSPGLHSQEGKLVYIDYPSMALRQNILQDSPVRSVIIYLPPGYDTDTEIKYPVVFLLHGYDATNTVWLNYRTRIGDKEHAVYQGFHIKTAMDSLIAAGEVKKMIFVLPHAENRYKGSFYANSPVIGNWEDFITIELVNYLAENFRIIDNRDGRGIAGHSMGGYGALTIAMKHSDVFCAVYGLSAYAADFREEFLNKRKNDLISAMDAKKITDFERLNWFAQLSVAAGSVAASNPENPPFFIDFPFVKADGTLLVDELIWNRWLEHDPSSMVKDYKKNLLSLRGIQFDCGTSDWLITQNLTFSGVLTENGIHHIFEEYDGDHLNRIKHRMITKVLPFFSSIFYNSK